MKSFKEYLTESDKSVVKINSDGDKLHYHSNTGRLHRIGGPAIERADGSKEYYEHGRRHNENGPAVITTHGAKSWYIHGKLQKKTKE